MTRKPVSLLLTTHQRPPPSSTSQSPYSSPEPPRGPVFLQLSSSFLLSSPIPGMRLPQGLCTAVLSAGVALPEPRYSSALLPPGPLSSLDSEVCLFLNRAFLTSPVSTAPHLRPNDPSPLLALLFLFFQNTSACSCPLWFACSLSLLPVLPLLEWVCSLLHPKPSEECPAHSRRSVNVCPVLCPWGLGRAPSSTDFYHISGSG